jgi:dTDP-D-glucose 4,6-dehydratase
MVDVIIKYENLYEDLKKIKINHIPHLNSSKIEGTSPYNLTKASIDRLYQIYKEDFKLL